MSCSIFERFSSALQYILQSVYGCFAVFHILDDFMFVGPPNCSSTQRDLDAFISLASKSGIPVKHSKTVLPSTVIVAHGIELDSVAMQARLPQDKIDRARSLIEQYCTKRRITVRDVQSLVGLLNFACKVIRLGRAFLRRLIELTSAAHRKHHYIKLTASARADIYAWLEFLNRFNGISIFLHD
jgi:hypothetical protein